MTNFFGHEINNEQYFFECCAQCLKITKISHSNFVRFKSFKYLNFRAKNILEFL